jgi:hypothetical protein
MKKSAPAEAQMHDDKTLCFIRRMEEFRSWYCRNLKRTKRYKQHTAAMKARARVEAEANPDGPFRDVLVQFPKNPKEPPIGTYGEPRVRAKASKSVDASA